MTTTYTAQQVLSANSQGLDLGAAVILDSSADVLADLDQLEPIAAAGKISSVAFTDSPAPSIFLSGSQAIGDLDVVKRFQGSYSLNAEATVAQAEQIVVALPGVSVWVQDDAGPIAASLDQLQSIAGNLKQIDVNAVQGSAMITLTQAQVTADQAAVALLVSPQGGLRGGSGVVISVSGTLTIEQGISDEALNAYIDGQTVVDSAVDIDAALATIVSRADSTRYADGNLYRTPYHFESITLTDSGTPTIVAPFSQAHSQDISDILSDIVNPHAVIWTGVPIADVATLLNAVKPATETSIQVDIQDTAATVASVIDYLEPYDLAGQIHSITVTDGVLPVFTTSQSNVDGSVISKITVSGLTASSAIADAGQLSALHGVAVQDSAANISASVDGLESIAAAGKLVSVTLTDNTAIPTVAITTAQASADAAALGAISGKFTVIETASGSSESIVGVQNAVGNTVVFADPSSSYTVTPDGNGSGFTVTESGVSDHLSNIQAVQFSDVTEIIASQTHIAGAVSSAQITTLYAAVFDRQPDIPGLGFYETYAATNPSVDVITYSEYFLTSPEYTSNSAHTYAQTTAGETQFITDTYNNLLHRAPETGAVAYYLAVIDPMLANLTPGTAAYAQADLVAHATVIAYFSQSPEFLADVTITAQNPASAQHWLQLV